MYYNKKKR